MNLVLCELCPAPNGNGSSRYIAIMQIYATDRRGRGNP